MATNEFYGALLSLVGDSILLPNLAVAEVVSAPMDEPPEGVPDWWVGQLNWNGKQVPVVSFEVLNGAELPTERRRGRIAVLNSLGVHLESGQIAIQCEGYPHLVALNRSAMVPVDLLEKDQDAHVLARVRLANTVACVPDLVSIERAIMRVENAGAASA